MNNKARPYELICGHKVWLTISPDSPEEMLYCSRCEAWVEQTLYIANTRGTWVTHPDEDFRSKRVNNRDYTGECLVEGCNETITKRGWFNLRDAMHSHHMRIHTKYGASLDIKYEDRKRTNEPPNEPPF